MSNAAQGATAARGLSAQRVRVDRGNEEMDDMGKKPKLAVVGDFRAWNSVRLISSDQDTARICMQGSVCRHNGALCCGILRCKGVRQEDLSCDAVLLNQQKGPPYLKMHLCTTRDLTARCNSNTFITSVNLCETRLKHRSSRFWNNRGEQLPCCIQEIKAPTKYDSKQRWCLGGNRGKVRSCTAHFAW